MPLHSQSTTLMCIANTSTTRTMYSSTNDPSIKPITSMGIHTRPVESRRSYVSCSSTSKDLKKYEPCFNIFNNGHGRYMKLSHLESGRFKLKPSGLIPCSSHARHHRSQIHLVISIFLFVKKSFLLRFLVVHFVLRMSKINFQKSLSLSLSLSLDLN